MTADLQYVLQDAEISLVNQYAVAQHYKNLRVFSQMGDTKAEVRTALKDDFRLDPAAGPDVRAEVARFISAWEVSKNFQQKNKRYGPRQRFWACPGTCRTMRGKRCLGPLKLHMDVYKKSKFLPTNTSPRKWRNVKVMNQQRQCLTKLLPNMTPRQLPYSRV